MTSKIIIPEKVIGESDEELVELELAGVEMSIVTVPL